MISFINQNMTYKMILLYICMIFCIIQCITSSSSSSSSSRSSSSRSINMMTFGNSILSLISSSPSNDNVECKDGVCSIKGGDDKKKGKSAKDLFKSKILDLESKGMSELEKKGKTTDEVNENFIPTNTNTETASNADTIITDDKTFSHTDASTSVDTTTTTTTTTAAAAAAPATTTSDVTINDNDINEKVSELVKMGWKKDEAIDALKKTNYDVSSAAMKLEEDQEEIQRLLPLIKELEGQGWSPEASESAVRQCDGNVTAAIVMLEKEEKIIVDEFEGAVKGMLDNGWEEVVARQALLAQWTIDQRKSMGINTTIPADVLASIKPTLKKIKEEEDTSNVKTKQGAPKAPKGSSQQQPKRANKEDCIFDVTAANFQKVVLESPCPVLVDIYADWCGPCKQLGPILEEAAMKSGGMFRLAKINSDNERAIAETLRVQGLPTVFSVNKGKVTDRFVGMLPQEQLQQFLVRTITGYGDRVQKNEVTDTMMDDATKDISQLAGLALLDFKKREKIRSMIDAALVLPGGADEQGTLSNGAKISMKYLGNVGKDIRNPKYRAINTTTAVFSEVASNECAMQLLDIAGFKKNDTKSSDLLELAHYNSAVISLVLNKVSDACQQKKFQKIKQAAAIGPSKSFRSKTPETTTTTTNTPATNTSKKDTVEKVVDKPKQVKIVDKPKKGEVVMSVRLSDGSAIKKNVKTSMKLNEALTIMLKDTSDTNWNDIEIRHPRRLTITRQSSELDSTIKELEFVEGFAIVVGSPKQAASTSSSSSSPSPKAKKIIKRKKGGTHTLLSTGITAAKKKKNNEYFGGDSTVTQAGEEDDDDDDDEDDTDDKKKK